MDFQCESQRSSLVSAIALFPQTKYLLHITSLQPGVQNGLQPGVQNGLNGWDACDGLASHPGGSSNISSCFALQKPELSTILMGHLVGNKTSPFYTLNSKPCSTWGEEEREQEMSGMLTSNISNFSTIQANCKHNQNKCLFLIWHQFGSCMTFLCPRNLMFPWQLYFDRNDF